MGRKKFNELRVYESILSLARKHHLDPKLLLDAFVTAWENDRSSFASLEITCRQKDHESAIFLVMSGGKVVSQFPIDVEILMNPLILQDFPDLSETDEMIDLKFTKIDDLRFKMKGVYVTAEVTDIPQKMLVNTRWGNKAYVSNVGLADDSGAIRLCLWNDQINKVRVGDVIQVENGYVHSFAGELQLRLRRTGTFSVLSRNS